MKISACIIAKNESAVIARCINSVRSVADEIILVDTGSTDDTVKIAEKLGAEVYYREWDNDFSAAKNYALDHAGGDWIIFLDADEYFADITELKLISKIMQLGDNSSIKALMCIMRHINAEDGSVFLQDYSLRVFKNNKDIRYKGIVHERLYDGEKELKYQILKDVFINHTGYSKENMAAKNARNYELLAKKVRLHPE
jgi:glycosyltransferase involved in cell wall biosynthesis